MVLIIATVMVLICIIYEDLKYRLVRLVYYMALLALLLFQRLHGGRVDQLFISASVNLIYIVFLLSCCLLFIYVKYRKISLLKDYLGAGDVFFLTAMAIWFEPVVFFLFNTVSFSIALLVGKVFRFRSASIPLAGIQSICFIPVFVYNGWKL